jgi:hypothetical protein
MRGLILLPPSSSGSSSDRGRRKKTLETLRQDCVSDGVVFSFF